MTDRDSDLGVLTALVNRFQEWQLPRAREIEARLDAGEKLTDEDLGFVRELLASAQEALPIAERNPDYKELAAQVIHYYLKLSTVIVDTERANS